MIIDNSDNNKYLKWIVNNNCNYDCSYCFEKNFEKKETDIIETAKKINSFMEINNLDSIILLGGELFLLDTSKILEVLEILKSKERKLFIITNFFKDNSEYIKVLNYAKENFNSFEYKFSFHDEYVSVNDFFNKVDDFIKKTNCKIKLQFTLDERTEKILPIFLEKCFKLESENKNISHHVEKAYKIFGKNRKNVVFSNVKTKVLKLFNVNKRKVSAEELFKNGPLDNYGAKCYQPFFHLENNVLYSHCYGRTITNDFLNYIPEKIDFNFICNRHSCLIYKTSIIQKIS